MINDNQTIPLLSIAIASYNRKDMVYELVSKILEYKSDEIEVAVTDDHSTDGTEELLQTITDPRFHLYVNETNYAGNVNFITSLFNTNGKYVLYCNDRDQILVEALSELLDFLRTEDYAYFYTASDKNVTTGQMKTYEKGFSSMISLPIACHVTGGVFNGEIMRGHLKPEQFYHYSKTHFPERFLARALSMYGKTGLYDKPVYHNGAARLAQLNMKSNTIISNKEEDFYFHPTQSWLLATETFNQILELMEHQLSNSQWECLTTLISNFMVGRIADYKRFRSMEGYQTRYRLQKRYVENDESYRFTGEYLKKLFIFYEEAQVPKHVIFRQKLLVPKHWAFMIKTCWQIEKSWKADGSK